MTKVAAVQMHVTADCSADDVFAMVDHAAKLGVKVLALPEYAFGPFGDPAAAEAKAIADQTPDLLVEGRRDRGQVPMSDRSPGRRARGGRALRHDIPGGA